MDEQLYLLGIGMGLDEKEEKAIATLRYYEPQALKLDPERGYYVCDSYGKDSDCIVDLAIRAGVKHTCHHNLTTINPPELIRFGRRTRPATQVNRPERHMFTQMIEKDGQGPPTRLARWCCELYKEHGGDGFMKVTGIRAEESPRRKAKWKVLTPNRRSGFILNPILYWTEQDVWRYHEKYNLPYCELYDEGFKRLGCVGCPMAGKKRYDEFRRWPNYEKAWRRAFDKWFAKWHNVPRLTKRWVLVDGKHKYTPRPDEEVIMRENPKTGEMEEGFWTFRRWFDLRDFTSGDDIWRWWMQEQPKPADDDCQMGQF